MNKEFCSFLKQCFSDLKYEAKATETQLLLELKMTFKDFKQEVEEITKFLKT